MQEIIPIVKDVFLYIQIAKNLVNPLELLRESISNYRDARSKNINIEVSRNSKRILCIVIEDDGIEMDKDSINVFCI